MTPIAKKKLSVGVSENSVRIDVGDETFLLSASQARLTAEALRKSADKIDVTTRGGLVVHTVPQPIISALKLEDDRQLRWLAALLERWPEYRREIAISLLGSTVATCDSFGVDVEAFVHELRRRVPMPDVLTPPERTRS